MCSADSISDYLGSQKNKKINQSGPHTAWRKWTCEKPRWLFWSPLFAIFTSPITSLGKPPVQICKLLSGCEDSFPSTRERERQDRQTEERPEFSLVEAFLDSLSDVLLKLSDVAPASSTQNLSLPFPKRHYPGSLGTGWFLADGVRREHFGIMRKIIAN